VDDIPWFNGGLFQTIAVPRLSAPTWPSCATPPR
jgi:hypothetical protein